MKKLIVILWFAVVLFGFFYYQETVYSDGVTVKWSLNGLSLLASGLLIAFIWISTKTYKLLRIWLHQQGLFDRSARLPIRLKFLVPFVICFFYFRVTLSQVSERATVETIYGWGDPAVGAICFLLISLFFIILQIHDILKRHVSSQMPTRLINPMSN